MKTVKFLIFVIALFVSASSFAQKDDICMTVDKVAQFPGGELAFNKFVGAHIDYSSLSNDITEEGTVYLRFVVEKDGKITNAEILRGLSPELNREAEKVISKLPNFEPALFKSSPVKSWYYVPVKFLPASKRKKSE